jgi:hypothetical protein
MTPSLASQSFFNSRPIWPTSTGIPALKFSLTAGMVATPQGRKKRPTSNPESVLDSTVQ